MLLSLWRIFLSHIGTFTTFYGKVMSPLGRSDHAMVYLVPACKQQLKCVKPTVKTETVVSECNGDTSRLFWMHWLGSVQRGRNRHSRIHRDSQRWHHLLYSNENNNKLPQRQTVVQYLYLTQATGETRCVQRQWQRQIQENEICNGKGRQDRQGQIPWQAWGESHHQQL